MPLDPILQRKIDGVQSALCEILAAQGLSLEQIENPFANPQLAAVLMSLYQCDLPYDPPQVRMLEETVAGPKGEFRIRVYQPDLERPTLRPALVWAHGGGFASGSIEMNEADLVSREVCARADAVVVSVDYHLANGVDVIYPQLHQECAAAWRWCRSHCEELGVDRTMIALGGASAGGALAIAATLEMRAREEALPACLVLAYPVARRTLLQGRPEFEAGMRGLPHLLRNSSENQARMFRTYLGARSEAPYATPEQADLKGFPRMLVIVSEYDDLRPGAEAFVEQARAAGVAVERYLARGVIHGHLCYSPALPEMDATLQAMADFVAD